MNTARAQKFEKKIHKMQRVGLLVSSTTRPALFCCPVDSNRAFSICAGEGWQSALALGDTFQFKGLPLAAYYTYEVQLFQTCPGELRDLYSDLRGRTLDAGILEDIRSELPRRRDIADGWGERDLPALFPRICAGGRTLPGRELVRRIKLNELFQSRDQVHAFVDQAGRRTSCLLHGTPENIASFLAGHALADRVTLMDTSYELILSASPAL